MDNMVKVKEEVGLEENIQIGIGFDECDRVIKKEISEESRLESTPKEIKSEVEDASSVSNPDLQSETHCFPPEFLVCKIDADICNETNYKTQVQQERIRLETTGSAASKLWLANNNRDTDNWKAEQLSPVESTRKLKEASNDDTYILPFSSDEYLEKKNCEMIKEDSTGSQETSIFHENDAGSSSSSSSVEEGVYSHNSKPIPNNHSVENYTLASALSSFIREVHKCTVCEKTFPQRLELRKHYLIHKEPLKCTICEKSFTQMHKLKNHYLTHDGKKPYKCEVCGKSFSQKYSLKEHHLIHQGKSPHKCEICGKSFTRKRSLQEHTFTHEGKKPFECKICETSFAQRSTLRTHILIHEETRPYKCEVCNKSFIRLARLKIHNSTHERTK